VAEVGLDRNYRLVGESLDQLDLFLDERFWSASMMTPMRDAFTQERDAKYGAISANSLSSTEVECQATKYFQRVARSWPRSAICRR
jgi:hypothetical protein